MDDSVDREDDDDAKDDRIIGCMLPMMRTIGG